MKDKGKRVILVFLLRVLSNKLTGSHKHTAMTNVYNSEQFSASCTTQARPDIKLTKQRNTTWHMTPGGIEFKSVTMLKIDVLQYSED
ncbi:hypothetical protein CsSME_00006437 [Camellia sinensis var. sinensis]